MLDDIRFHGQPVMFLSSGCRARGLVDDRGPNKHFNITAPPQYEHSHGAICRAPSCQSERRPCPCSIVRLRCCSISLARSLQIVVGVLIFPPFSIIPGFWGREDAPYGRKHSADSSAQRRRSLWQAAGALVSRAAGRRHLRGRNSR